MKYSLHPDALADLRGAAEFYRDESGVDLAQDFLDEFSRVISMLLQYPDLGSAGVGGRRRFHFRRFPYIVMYFVVGDELRILAIMHHGRRPGFGDDREWQ